MSLFTYDNVSWNLPVMFCHDEIIFVIGEILKAFPDIPRPKLFAYGCYTSPWAGGRDTRIQFFEKPFLENHLNKIIEAGFIPTFTFTRPIVKEEKLDDEMSNWILDYGVEHDCEFLVCSDKLYNHIKERQPEAKVSASILQGKMRFHNPKKRLTGDEEFEYYNSLMDKYERIVTRPEYIIENFEKDIPRLKDISKIEVHINETCLPNCPYAISCYSSMDNHDLYKDNQLKCGREEFNKKNDTKTQISYSIMIKKDFLDHLIYDCGIKHLKIQGRHYDGPYLYQLVFYHVFNMTGNFQTIYPALVEELKRQKVLASKYPPEQQVVLNQLKREYDMEQI